MLKVLLSSNEPRARFLFAELARYVEVVGEEGFADIDPLTKWTAAALSFRKPWTEWWRTYQMQPLLQRRRRLVLQRAMRQYRRPIDALLMWGSWFHPTKNGDRDVPWSSVPDPLPMIADVAPLRLPRPFNLLFVCTFSPDEPYLAVLEVARLIDPEIGIYVTGDPRGKADPEPGPDHVVFCGRVPWERYDQLLLSVNAVIGAAPVSTGQVA